MELVKLLLLSRARGVYKRWTELDWNTGLANLSTHILREWSVENTGSHAMCNAHSDRLCKFTAPLSVLALVS